MPSNLTLFIFLGSAILLIAIIFAITLYISVLKKLDGIQKFQEKNKLKLDFLYETQMIAINKKDKENLK